MRELLVAQKRLGDVDEVMAALSVAVKVYSQFTHKKPRRAGKQFPSKGVKTIKDARAELAALAKSIDEMQKDLLAVSPITLLHFSRARAYRKRELPRGRVLASFKDLGSISEDIKSTVERASELARNEPDKPGNTPLVSLAYKVGLQLKTLGVALSISEESSEVSGRRGGAVWARVTNLLLSMNGYQVRVDKGVLRAARGWFQEFGD
ncbi:hypothetical protein FCE95_07700 [Luteimonas gilva]|uniref:Uncharacterized protein n=1 Tax=Luteimonas gilva TaxID=2572684 RepID=A0A4U5JZ62_9GAMM|nr:hypothetical protein [Luteimonas gilva]TKR34138.1 hypothetical protein FCE95_07700 [Luteimonas gilva]